MSSSRKRLIELLKLLDDTAVEEIDCTEFLDRVAGLIDRFEKEGAAPAGYEDVLQHLKVCAECREECDTLLRALREEDSA